MNREVLLIDFGMGNLRSVCRALERAGAKPRVSRDAHEVARADRVVVPGVGSCGAAMRNLVEDGLDAALRERIAAGRPYLGICLGLQILLERAEEGSAECLGVIPGAVRKFPASLELAVPHMGWNEVSVARAHPVLRSGYYYFVHSYRATGVSEANVAATTEYGEVFPSAIQKGACVAVQFHPEKSQRDGLALLERFLAWAP
jgi:imidazole glycerol-phosphate synthase subunit HisH